MNRAELERSMTSMTQHTSEALKAFVLYLSIHIFVSIRSQVNRMMSCLSIIFVYFVLLALLQRLW
jgi:hypothetical protein